MHDTIHVAQGHIPHLDGIQLDTPSPHNAIGGLEAGGLGLGQVDARP